LGIRRVLWHGGNNSKEDRKPSKEDTNTEKSKEVSKGARWMPGLTGAKKGVISCEKLRGGANSH
jgi:hypothetical protein